MAAAAALAEYKNDRAETRADLLEDGYEADFGQYAEGQYGTEGDYQSIGLVAVFPLEFDAKFSADVRSDDRFFMCDGFFDLTQCTVMKDHGEVVLVKPFRPVPEVTLYYKVQVRQ